MPPLVIADAQTRSKSTTRSVSEVSGSLAPKQNAWQVVGVCWVSMVAVSESTRKAWGTARGAMTRPLALSVCS